MEYTMFADESGTNDGSPCFTIGCLLIPSEHLDQFEAEIKALTQKHNLPASELKWEGLRKSHGRINFLIDVVKLLLSNNPYVWVCKVTLKAPYQKWRNNEEEAFYTCHTHLITYCARELNATIVAKIDDKSDAYDKQHEVVQVIANYNLKHNDGKVAAVNKEDSKEELLIQIADLLTGAVNTSHNLFQNPSIALHNGKRLAIERVALCLGWHQLHHDTYPNTFFNIWHFPEKEFRARPSTEEIKANFNVPFVTPEDLS